jgi:GDP-L-fucose synthase
MEKNSKIYIAGHKGLVGSSILRTLKTKGYKNLITRSHKELDLMRQARVEDFFKQERPEYVFLVAGKVGGILANDTYPAEFIYNNIMMEANIIHSSYLSGVTKLLFLGSSCIYPRDCPQPMKEEHLLSGYLEKTNEPYAIAKIAGIKMCQSFNRQYGTNFISGMPTNLYGPNDNFDLESSHVIPALVRKFHEAKSLMEKEGHSEVVIWGTGIPRREFLYVDDLSEACIFLMENYNENEIINIGTGDDLTIQELCGIIKNIVDYKGEIIFDPSKPDGTPKKLLDITKIKFLGWAPSVDMTNGLKKTYEWYIQNK